MRIYISKLMTSLTIPKDSIVNIPHESLCIKWEASLSLNEVDISELNQINLSWYSTGMKL